MDDVEVCFHYLHISEVLVWTQEHLLVKHVTKAGLNKRWLVVKYSRSVCVCPEAHIKL